jgi:hypothetical protein
MSVDIVDKPVNNSGAGRIFLHNLSPFSNKPEYAVGGNISLLRFGGREAHRILGGDMGH